MVAYGQRDLRPLLASYRSSPANAARRKQPPDFSMARDIYSRYTRATGKPQIFGGEKYAVGTGGGGGGKGPSVLSRVFDILSRPLYAEANVIAEGVDKAAEGDLVGALVGTLGPGALPAAWRGFSGQEKREYIDIMLEHGVSKKIAIPLGLGLDIGLDPLNVVPGLGFTKLSTFSKLGRGTQSALKPTVGMLDEAEKAAAARAAVEVPEVAASGSRVVDDIAEATTGVHPTAADTTAATKETVPRIVADKTAGPAGKDLLPFPSNEHLDYTPHMERTPEAKGALTQEGRDELARRVGEGKTPARDDVINFMNETVTNAKATQKAAFDAWEAELRAKYQALTDRQVTNILNKLKNDPKADITSILRAARRKAPPVGSTAAAAARLAEDAPEMAPTAAEAVADAVHYPPRKVNGTVGGKKVDVDIPEGRPDHDVARHRWSAQEHDIMNRQSKMVGNRVDDADKALNARKQDYSRTVASGKGNKHFNIDKQWQLFNQIRGELGYLKGAKRDARALAMTRQAIREIEKRISKHTGKPMQAADFHGKPLNVLDVVAESIIRGVNKPVTDIMSDISRSFSKNPEVVPTVPQEVRDAIAAVRAGTAKHQTPILIDTVDKGTKASKAARTAAQAAGASRPAQAAVGAEAVEEALAGAKAAGATDDTLRDAKKILDPEPPPATIEEGYKIEGTTAKGALDDAVTRGEAERVENGMFATFGRMFINSFGHRDLHPGIRAARSLAERNHLLFRQGLRSMWQASRAYGRTIGKSADEIGNEAWDAMLNGTIDAHPDAFIRQLGLDFRRYFENMHGNIVTDTNKLYEEALKYGAMHKGDVLMEEVNKHLKDIGLPWRYGNEIKIGDEVFDLSEGGKNPLGWLASWKYFGREPSKNVFEEFSKLDHAIQYTLMKRTFTMSLIQHFGSKNYINGWKRFSDPENLNPHLEGVYFHPELMHQVVDALKHLDEVERQIPKWVQKYDKIMRIWKLSVTIFNPRHHVNSLLGDLFFNFVAGAHNPRDYLLASKILYANKGVIKNINEIGMQGEQRVNQLIQGNVRSIKIRSNNGHKGGFEIDAQTFFEAMAARSVFPGAAQAADILRALAEGGTRREITVSGGLGLTSNKVKTFAEYRDYWPRLSQALMEFRKSTARSLEDALDVAATRTMHFHPDGTDMTLWERRWPRRIIPFYSWLRKAMPLMIEQAAFNPARTVTAFPKATLALQRSFGIEDTTLSDPFPQDQDFPDYIRHIGIGPIFPPGTNVPTYPEQHSYGIVNPRLPFYDFADTYLDPTDPQRVLRNIASSLTPGIKIPIELATRKELFTQHDIGEGDVPFYALQQLPIVGTPARLAATEASGGELKPQSYTDWFRRWMLGYTAPQFSAPPGVRQ